MKSVRVFRGPFCEEGLQKEVNGDPNNFDPFSYVKNRSSTILLKKYPIPTIIKLIGSKKPLFTINQKRILCGRTTGDEEVKIGDPLLS